VEKIKGFLEALKKKIDEGKEFPFWMDLEKAEALAEEIEEEIEGKIEEDVVIEGKVRLGKGSRIRGKCFIEGNLWVGENTTIGPFAHIREFAFIGNNCHVGRTEVKGSVILNSSKASHFSYIGDSVIGEKVNFGAGCKIANLRFDDANVKVSINGEKIDSGRRKLGALVMHGTKTGINSVISCGKIVGKNCVIYPLVHVKKNLKEGEVLKN